MPSSPLSRLLAYSPMRSVRARFSLVMALAGILFGSLVTLSMEWRWERAARTQVHERLHLTAHRIASALVHDLESRQHEVTLLGDLIGSDRLGSPDEIRAPFDRLKSRQPDYAWLGYARRDGRVLAASNGLLEGVDVGARPWFQSGLKGPFLGDPHLAQLLAPLLPPTASGEPPRFVDVAAPVRSASGEVRGVVGAHLFWDWAQSIVTGALQDIESASDFEILIANPAGELLMQPASVRHRTLAQLAADADDARLHLSAQASVPFRQLDAGLTWVVVVREPLRSAYMPIRDSRRLMVWVSLLAALGFGAVAWLISGRVVRPIVELADEARLHRPALAGSALPQGPHDETGVVGEVMHQLAFQDALTGLPNRRQLRERLGQVLARPGHGALLLLDLDDFSDVNDTRGHEVGDLLLATLAQRLAEATRPGDMLARLGSDEFVLLLPELADDEAGARARAREHAERLLALVHRPIELAGERSHVQASIGVRTFGTQPLTAADVLQQVEVAMFEAKRPGHDKICLFDTSMQEALDERVQFETELRLAVPTQLQAVLQRQVDGQGRVIGAELLLRWRHPVMGMVSPGRFIPLAEQTGLILPIGAWVLDTACRLIARWAAQPGLRDLVLSINVSAREFNQPAYVGQVERALSEHGAAPSRLRLELTESALAHDVERVVEHMRRLKAIGVSFALDDFGTGFSSLAYLQRMPLDELKIDQSFVRSLPGNENDAAIVRTVITLGRNLGMSVIAEGVETTAQREFLGLGGCDRFQGYLFGRPEAVEDFEADCGART